ncbi:hypothetical protein [Qipengyuania sp. MTN3-11]|uniref:hypothetical protein n=1 Tax=Qipengyuania sp. MTN3-11 TaxID=3056557 RepID=UPI0036F34BAF
MRSTPARPPAATEGSEDSLSERTRAPALEAKRKTPRQATSAVAHRAAPPEQDDPLLDFAPYLHAAPRANSITPDVQRAFIAQLAATGIVTQAAMKVGKSMEALYKLKHRPGAEGFAAAWEAALDLGIARLEDSALARAIEGTPVWKTDGDGGLITYGTKHNEALVMFFLRNRRPERYSDHIRPGHPVYERIRAEVLAGQPPRPARADPAEPSETRECALSRHFADRLARGEPAMLEHREGDGGEPARDGGDG